MKLVPPFPQYVRSVLGTDRLNQAYTTRRAPVLACSRIACVRANVPPVNTLWDQHPFPRLCKITLSSALGLNTGSSLVVVGVANELFVIVGFSN